MYKTAANISDSNEVFSFYRAPIKHIVPHSAITLRDVADLLTGDKYRNKTLYLRGLKERDYKAKKVQILDYVTFSGTFTKRANESLIQHSGLICVDLDNLDNPRQTKKAVLKHFAPVLVFISPGRKGLKVVYRIDIKVGSHLDYFLSLESFFKSEFKISIDDKCKDVSRCCFLCHDPGAYLNLDAEILSTPFLDTFPGMSAPDDGNSVGEYQNDPPTESNPLRVYEIIESLKRWLDKKMVFAKGNRNGYITHLAGAYNRVGISERDALDDLLSYAEPGFMESEIRATVKSIYRNKAFHNIAKFDENKPFDFPDDELYTKNKKASKTTPPFPVDGFIPPLRDFISAYNNVYRVPPDYIAASVFFSVALAIGNKLELRDKYVNIPILWMALVGYSSSGKTNPLLTALQYFINEDKKSYRSFKENKSLRDAYEKLTKKEKQVTEEVSEPFYFQYVVNDHTQEALFKVHEINNRGLVIYRDEIQGWIDDNDRYTKSGAQSTMLSTFNRQPLAINRKGSDPINIYDPVIYVAGGIQPDLLENLAKDKRAENGFLSRMLFVYPDGGSKPKYSKEKLPDSALPGLYGILEALTGLEEVTELSLSEDAEDIYCNWYNENATTTDQEETGYLKGVYGKFDVYVLRFAIVFHGMNRVYYRTKGNTITAGEMKAAVELVPYFRATALKVYDKIFSDKAERKVSRKDVIKYLYSVKGMGQTEIAKFMGVSRQRVFKIINENRPG